MPLGTCCGVVKSPCLLDLCQLIEDIGPILCGTFGLLITSARLRSPSTVGGGRYSSGTGLEEIEQGNKAGLGSGCSEIVMIT